MSLHVLADHMASKGRNGDSMLVHMTPGEVAGLHALALKHGGSLTINPDTGLPEASFLKSLLPMLAGAALNFFVPGLGAAVGGAFGVGAAAGTGIAVGGLTTLATGSLSRGLMAGMGAYGGAGLTEGFMGAGAQELAATGIPMAENVAGAAIPPIEQINPSNFAMSNADKLSTGIQGLGTEAGRASALANMGGTSGALKYAAAAASPIMADMMVPTTTKMPSPTDTGYIRQKVYDPGTQTYRSLTPVKANEWKDRNFSDIYRGYNGGGIVALAEGGDGTAAVAGAGAATPAISSVEDLYTQVLGRAPDAGGLAYWQQGFGDTIDANEIASFKQAAQAELANRSAPEQQILAPNLVNTSGGAPATTSVADLYQGILGRAPESAAAASYWQNQFGNTIDANELAQFKTAAQAEIDARNAGTTGGITNLATTGGTSLADAQAQVNNMYRNVLGRDADPAGLAFWSNAIASGRSPESIYQDFLTSARANTELVRADQIGAKTFAEATTPYKGYMSTDTSNIVDEWVRNTLGREPTAADKQQTWYKDAADKMRTQEQAKGLYGQFQGYATKEATTEMANRIKAIDAELKAKNLTEADLLAQTGKTKQQLASEGLNTGLNWMGASQLAPAGARTAFDLKAKLAELKPVTTPQTNAPAGTTNPYGNATNPGDITFNRDGTTTVTPNIPGRPYGGFPGMAAVKDAYTQGGGSLGYTPYAPKTAAEHAVLYNNLTGDSEAAYNYLMGKGAYPTKSRVGEIAQPYREATLGYPSSTNKAYNYDAATGKMVRNPDYVAPSRDSKGNVTYGMSLSEIKKYLGTKPLAGQELYNWAQSNDISAQDVADATDRKLSDVYAEFRAAAKKAADTKAASIGTGVGESGSYEGGSGGFAMGGMTGYAVGGGLGALGSYSDGGRLLKGPGDGVSDSIPATIGAKQQPARLADGEFVIPARIVSELGNGSTDAGAKKLYAMMDRVQKARGKTTGKNKVAANSRAEKYLPA